MVKKRPQLNADELLQWRWLLGGATALTGAWAAWFLDVGAGWILGFATAAILAAMWKPAWPGRVPAWLHRLAFPAMTAFGVYDFYAQGEVLPVTARLALLLLTYRAITYRRRRDELQLVVLGLFLVVIAGVLTVSMGFAVHIVIFTGLALALLMAMTLSEGTMPPAERKGTAAPAWAERVDWWRLFGKVRDVMDWRLWLLGGILFAGVAVVSGLLFLAIPRFELRHSLFLEGLIKRKSGSGFTDTMRFGDVTDIMRDESVAMRVEVSDRAALPAELYWRMVVMDEYRDQAFRVSNGLRATAFERPITLQRLGPTEPPSRSGLSWTFYVEPGTGRYVPLTGGFASLSFSEPQNFRASRSLRVIELTREPMAMKAYRVRGMSGSEMLRDREFANWNRLPADERRARNPNRPAMTEIALGAADREMLDRALAEITGGVELSAAEFSQKARAWLGARHRYSLNMRLPPGEGDPLVRWIVSTEPGHCELFSGAFVLLARAAGHPARVVGGFLGGTWNGDYLMVRNSDAHAWCEIFDGRENWVRVDPTAEAGGGGLESGAGGPGGGALREEEGTWAARLDRLRLFWYRRVVNFDQSDQRALTATLKENAEGAGRRLKDFGKRAIETVRGWFSQPWSAGRVVGWAGVVVLMAMLGAGWRWRGRAWWLSWRSRRTKRVADPVRMEAGRWLRRLRGDARPGADDPAMKELRAQLERVRYGPRESWPATAALWRRARRLQRRAGRRRD